MSPWTLGGGRSIQLSYADIFNFWLIYWVSGSSGSHPEGFFSSNRFSNFGGNSFITLFEPAALKKQVICALGASYFSLSFFRAPRGSCPLEG